LLLQAQQSLSRRCDASGELIGAVAGRASWPVGPKITKPRYAERIARLPTNA
jgi:hypothetical protein